MSEILVGDPGVITAEYPSNETVTSTSETIEDRVAELDRVLTPLVAANAGVVVKCPWLGNAEVTLREAMIAYPKPMIEEDPYTLTGVVMELLADRKTEVDENMDDETEEEEAEPAEDKSYQKESNDKQKDKARAKPNKVTTERNTPTEVKIEVKPVQPNSKIANARQPKIEIAEALHPSNDDDKVEAAAKSDNAGEAPPREVAGGFASTAAENPAGADNHRPAQSKGAVGNISKSSAPEPTLEPDSRRVRQQLTESPRAESLSLPTINETAAELESIDRDLAVTDAEAIGTAYDVSELADEVTEVATSKPGQMAFDYQIDNNDFVGLEEEAILIDRPEADFDPDEPVTILDSTIEVMDTEFEPGEEINVAQSNDELTPSELIEINGPETLHQPKELINEVEHLLTALTDLMETGEPEMVKAANELLDKIGDASAKLEANGDKNKVSQSEIQEELEELFTELFDGLGIEYTPELVESLARSTMEWRLAGEVEKPRDEKTIDKVLQYSGTHEIIRILLLGSNTIRKVETYACALGRSALRLYNNRVLFEEYLGL